MHSPLSRLVKLVGVLALFAFALPLAGCTSTQSILEPAAQPARDITGLFYFIFYLALVIFVLVEGLLIYFVIRYQRRAKSNQDLPPQFHGNTRIEIAWTLAPAIVLAVVFFMTVRTMTTTNITAQPPATVEVRVIGHQWWWEFQYPKLGITTANEMHVPVGQVVDITLESDNVIHSFWVPQLMGKTDVVPNHVNRTWIRAEQVATYNGQCAEFCGAQHAHMLFKVISDDPGTFDAWVKGQQAAAATPSGGDAARGLQVFTSNGGCFACHTVSGVEKANGKVGPNLTHIGSRTTIAAGTLTNTPENLSTWLHNPQAVKPGNFMIIAKLSDADIQALVAYLESLK